eukprot:g36737.t1
MTIKSTPAEEGRAKFPEKRESVILSQMSKLERKVVVQKVGYSRFVDIQCPACPPITFEEDKDPKKRVVPIQTEGVLTCGRCGCVLQDNLPSEEQEYRTFADDDGSKGDPIRVGAAADALTADMSLSTYIARDPEGSGPIRNTMDPKQQALEKLWQKVDDMVSKIELNRKVKEDAKAVMKAIHNDKDWKHRKNDELVAAIIYDSCKALPPAISIKALMNATGLQKKQISKALTRLEKWKKKQVEIAHAIKAKREPTAGMQIQSTCSKLRIPFKIELRITQMVKTMAKEGYLDGKEPGTKLGAAILLATQVSGDGDDVQSKSKIHAGEPPYEIPTADAIAEVVLLKANTLIEAYDKLWSTAFSKEIIFYGGKEITSAKELEDLERKGANVQRYLVHKWWRVPLIYYAFKPPGSEPVGRTFTAEECLALPEKLRRAPEGCRCCQPPVVPHPDKVQSTTPDLVRALAKEKALKETVLALKPDEEKALKEAQKELTLAQTEVRM